MYVYYNILKHLTNLHQTSHARVSESDKNYWLLCKFIVSFYDIFELFALIYLYANLFKFLIASPVNTSLKNTVLFSKPNVTLKLK